MADARSRGATDHRVVTHDAVHIAGATVAAWQEIDDALRPVIGQQGVYALYKRSVHLTASSHGWLAGLHEGAEHAMDLAALRGALARQDGADARAGSAALLQTLHELLAGLVGPSLAGQLLYPVWTREPGGAAAQDTAR